MVDFAKYSNVGSREINEDSIGIFNKEGRFCFVLCDGLGGHGMGDMASKLVVDVFGSMFNRTDENVNFLGDAFSYAEECLLKRQVELKAKSHMKTTAVSALFDDDKLLIGHVGDSRAYIFRKNKIFKRTLDHSIPQMLVLSRQIKEKEIRNHPDRNVLLKVMGVEWEEPMYELMEPIPLKKSQAVLLCSDGFWELITEDEMCACLKKSKSATEWLAMMAKIVSDKGKDREMDNNTAIAIWADK